MCTLPLLEALHKSFPNAAIDWLVDELPAQLIQGHPFLRETIIFPRNNWSKNLARPLREHFHRIGQRKYDVALDVQGNLKSAMNLYFVRAERKIGFSRRYSKEGNFLFIKEPVTPPGERIHRVRKNLSLLEPLGVPAPTSLLSVLPVDPVAATRVEQYLKRDELEGKKLAILHPGTSVWGQDKQWPTELFGILARKLSEELQFTPILSWGPGEKWLAELAASKASGKAKVAFETKTLKEFAALVSKCSLFIAGDTGALQIASFLNRPTVGIFGPTDPVIYGPLGTQSAVAQPPDLIGPPPSRKRSQRSELMEQISVDQVFHLAKAILESG